MNILHFIPAKRKFKLCANIAFKIPVERNMRYAVLTYRKLANAYLVLLNETCRFVCFPSPVSFGQRLPALTAAYPETSYKSIPRSTA